MDDGTREESRIAQEDSDGACRAHIGRFDARLRAEGLLALEGSLLVERGMAAGLEIVELFCVPAREAWARSLAAAAPPSRRPSVSVLPESGISAIASYRFHRGALGIARRPPVPAPIAVPASGGATYLVLPEASDPENIGSAFRSASALGGTAILMGPAGPDPYSRRVLRVSMGASLTLPWTRLRGPEDLAELTLSGFLLTACVLSPEAVDLRDFRRKDRLALVVGNESRGLSARWLEVCEARVTLPMAGGTDSLNLAAAVAVFLYATRIS